MCEGLLRDLWCRIRDKLVRYLSVLLSYVSTYPNYFSELFLGMARIEPRAAAWSGSKSANRRLFTDIFSVKKLWISSLSFVHYLSILFNLKDEKKNVRDKIRRKKLRSRRKMSRHFDKDNDDLTRSKFDLSGHCFGVFDDSHKITILPILKMRTHKN